MTLGEKLQKLRKEKNLSQEQLAEALAVSRQAVSKWELADAIPDTDKIVLLANYFDVSTDYLLQENAARATQVPTSENMPTHTESGIKWLCITIICMTALNALLLVLFHRMQVAQFILPVSITAISVLLYFVFTHMRTSGDYTMLAGFQKDAVYEMESFKKMVESIAFYILLSNFWYAFMLHILLWCTPPKIINPILIVVYVLETTGVIVLLNFKYGNRIYKEKTRDIEREVKKGTTL
ncbi:MAG: helix-turn-helix transcriptional regulator, partial [Ruthenibacterium sp.]